MRFYSGRECWVFRAREISELCGHHAEVMAGAIDPAEPLSYLLYAPLRETTVGPFGIRGSSGSHALAVARDRLVISRDSHGPPGPPTVRPIPFSDLLSLEIGEALTLGWLVVRFSAAGGVETETVFFQSSGIDHFRAAVRAVRDDKRLPSTSEGCAEWAGPLPDSPDYLRDPLSGIMTESERIGAAVYGREVWRTGGSRHRPTLVSSEMLGVRTDAGLLVVQSERRRRPGELVFGVNTTLVGREAIRSITVHASSERMGDVSTLRVQLARASRQHVMDFTIGLPAEQVDPMLCRREDRGE